MAKRSQGSIKGHRNRTNEGQHNIIQDKEKPQASTKGQKSYTNTRTLRVKSPETKCRAITTNVSKG